MAMHEIQICEGFTLKLDLNEISLWRMKWRPKRWWLPFLKEKVTLTLQHKGVDGMMIVYLPPSRATAMDLGAMRRSWCRLGYGFDYKRLEGRAPA